MCQTKGCPQYQFYNIGDIVDYLSFHLIFLNIAELKALHSNATFWVTLDNIKVACILKHWPSINSTQVCLIKLDHSSFIKKNSKMWYYKYRIRGKNTLILIHTISNQTLIVWKTALKSFILSMRWSCPAAWWPQPRKLLLKCNKHGNVQQIIWQCSSSPSTPLMAGA